MINSWSSGSEAHKRATMATMASHRVLAEARSRFATARQCVTNLQWYYAATSGSCQAQELVRGGHSCIGCQSLHNTLQRSVSSTTALSNTASFLQAWPLRTTRPFPTHVANTHLVLQRDFGTGPPPERKDIRDTACPTASTTLRPVRPWFGTREFSGLQRGSRTIGVGERINGRSWNIVRWRTHYERLGI